MDSLTQFINPETFIELLLGISLSAAAGFRVFVPLLAVSIAAVIGHMDLPTEFDWAETPQAVLALAAACVLEVVGYYIPWFDHLLDTVATPAALIAGTVVAASVAPDMNPVIQWTLALVAGGGTAGLTKILMNFVRATSTTTTGGLGNPIVATIELIIATVLSVLAITVPVIAGILVIGAISFIGFKLWKFLAARKSSPLTPNLTP